MPDPCPLPSMIQRRGLNEKERLLYAPMADVGGLLYDKDAVYIDVPDWKVSPSNVVSAGLQCSSSRITSYMPAPPSCCVCSPPLLWQHEQMLCRSTSLGTVRRRLRGKPWSASSRWVTTKLTASWMRQISSCLATQTPSLAAGMQKVARPRMPAATKRRTMKV